MGTDPEAPPPADAPGKSSGSEVAPSAAKAPPPTDAPGKSSGSEVAPSAAKAPPPTDAPSTDSGPEERPSAAKTPPRLKTRYAILLLQSAGQLLSGFLVSLECAYFFGAGRAKDAWDVAYLIPDALLSFAGFALMQSVATATFARQIERADENPSRLFSTLVSLLLLSGAFMTAMGALLARPIVHVIAPGLGPAGTDMAVTQLYLLLPLTLLMGMSMFLGAVQTAYGFAGSNELAWLVLRTIVLVGLLLVPRSLGITGLSLVYIIGGVTALVIQMRLLSRTGLRYRFGIDLRSPTVRVVLRQSLGFGVSSLLTQIAMLQMRNLASRGPAGSIASLGYALSLSGLVYQFVAKPLMLVEGPRIIRRRESQGPEAARRQQTRIALIGLALTIPIVAVILIGREPLVRLLYERGAFDATATARTASFLTILCLTAFGDTLVAVSVLPALAQSTGLRVPMAFAAANVAQIVFMTAAFPGLGVGAVLWGAVLAASLRGLLVPLAGRQATGPPPG